MPMATYGYDSAERLTSVNNGIPGQSATYIYDGFNNRASQTVNGLTTNYLVDPSGSLPQLLAEFAGSGGSKIAAYIPGVGQEAHDGSLSYYGTDGLGSVRHMTNASGNPTYLTNFDPYGNPLEQNRIGGSSNLGYTGAPSDPSGLVYLNARFYNPSIGSF